MTELKEPVKLSDSLKVCKDRIEKLVRQNEMLIEDIARKDSMLNEEHKRKK